MMDNTNHAIDDQTWECYKTTSNNLEDLKVQISDIVQDYVLGSSVKLEECIKLFINQEKRYMLASCSAQEKPQPSRDAYPKECWVHFCAEKQASNYTVYFVDLTKNDSDVIAKEQLERTFLDKFCSQAVHFVWLDDYTSNGSLSWGLGNLKASICLSGDSIVVAPSDSSLGNCLLIDKLIIEYGLSRKVRAKNTLLKILYALHRILKYDKTYCPSEEELVNLTGILVSKNFIPQKPNEKDLQDEVIKILCKIEGHAKITEKCLENIHKYFCDNRCKYSEIINRYEMELLSNGITPEVKAYLSLAIRDRRDFLMASVQLIPREKIAYEMLNDLVCYLVDNKAEHFVLQEQELEEKIRNMQLKLRGVSENEGNSIYHELFEIQQQLTKVRKELDCNLNKAEIVESFDLNELLLLLGEQSKHPCNCLHMLNQQSVNMLIENARREISEGSSLALIRIIASLPKEIKMTLSVKHFLFPVPDEDEQWIIKLGLEQKLVTEDIDVLCETIYEILLNSENPFNRRQAVNVLEMHKEQLSEKVAELLELERNYINNGDISGLLKYVERGRPIPQNYFCTLLPLNEINIDLLEQLTESNIQKFPELIIRELKSCISESSNPSVVLRSFKLLLKLEHLSWSDPEIRVLLRNPVHTEVILDHILNSFVITDIPEILLKEIKNLPKTNHVKYFLDEVQIESVIHDITAKLKNPNMTNEEKKKIIKSITNMKFLDSKKIVELLENIIKCDDNLRTEALQALIKMVPKEYEISKILQYLDIKSFTDQDMAALKAKHCNLIPLLNEIIKYLYSTNTDHVELSSLLEMTLVSELSFKQFCLLLNFAKYSNNKEVRSRIKRFIQGTIYGEEEVVDIMQYLEFLEGFCLQNDPELNTLHHCVEDGYGITEELLSLLINILQSKIYLKQKRRIESILFNISQHQNIPSGVWHSLLKIIEAGTDSHLSPEFIAFIANMCQAQLSNRALKSMFKFENSLNALCGIGNYAEERTMPSSVLHMVGKILIDLNENIETRTLAAAILAHQEERCVNLPQIITVKLQQEFFSDLLCSKISEEYQILRDFLKDDDHSFHKKFYALRGLSSNQVVNAAILWKCCINYCFSEISEEYKVLLDFLQDNFKSFHEKFYLLRGLSSSEAVNKTILSNFCMNDWRKEFFSYNLFIEMIQIKEESNEFKLKEFRDNMNKLHQFLEKNDKTHTSEAVYEALLRKQRTFAFGLTDGINVLIMLQSNPDAIHLLFNSSDNFVQKLKYSWLSYSLQMRKIGHTSSQLDELCKYLVFRTTVLEHFLQTLRGKSSVQHLTKFFQMLTESDLPLSSKEEFLMDGTDLLSVNQWKSKLAQFLAQKMLQQKLQDHKMKTNFNIMETVKKYLWTTNTATEQCVKGIKKHPEKFLAYLLLSGWSEQSLFQLVPNLNTKERFTAFLWSSIIIYDYQLTISTINNKGESLHDVLKKYPANCWEEKIHKVALFNSFKGTCTKTVPDLIREIYELNEYTEVEYLNEQKLKSDFEAVIKKYNSCSALLVNLHEIKFWEEDEIKCWAGKVRQAPNNADLFEKIAVIKRAVEISCRFWLRDIQLLTVLILLQANGKNGCLAQVNTGEGKTIIIAMIAAIHSLTGCTVDVVTSSPELARPQSQEMQNFFSLMKLTAAHNTEKNEKTCYKADIVYGAASNFQGDILRDEYNQLGIRCGRSCNIAIVDEVDSMLIDNRNYKVMLSSPMPAMNHLEPILAAIWVQIDAAASVLVEKNGILFYKKNPDELFPIEINKEEFIKMCVRKHIRKLLRVEKLSSEEENYAELKIPKHLMKLVSDVQLHKWIDCALYAKYGCEHDRHYIIKDNKIIPVDASNTGVVQKNMHWNDGLHQFLQIKHGLRITPESLCTNFISNVAYFQRYKRIYGLTGTLGSTNAINLLKKVYNVSNVFLPPFKKGQHLELKPIIAMNEREHHETIVENSLSKLNNGRAVLIIAKYIAEAKKLHNMFIHEYGYKEHKVKTYQTESDTSIIKENLKPGEVIIATNIAGRGTDVKLDHEVEQNGGLHVCVTFLPSNLRTEKQNVGRTSRNGHKGTSQFIILNKHKSITEIIKERDKQEEDALKSAENEIKIVCMHDEVFARFCELLKVVQNKDDSNNDIKMKAIEERFALWFQLQRKDFENGEAESIKQSFEFFRCRIELEAKDGSLIENPYFYVQIGNRFLEDEKYDEAIDHYTKAIKIDPDFGENAYFNRGYAYIAKYGHDGTNYEKKLYDAVEDFTKAKDIIERCEQYLHIMQLTHSEVTEQVCFKRKIYAIQKSAIDKAIGIENKMKNKGDFPSEPKEQNCHKGIIFQAIEKKWNLKITHQKLRKVFKDSENIVLYEKNISLSEAEIKESENNGCIGSFEIKMIKPPINWWALIGVAISGILHIICAIILCCFDFKALAWLSFAEGIKDFRHLIENIIKSRNFDWKQWGIQKAVSIVTGIFVSGFSTIKNVGTLFMSELKTVASTACNYAVATAKNFLQKRLQKPAEACSDQLNELISGLIECKVNKSIVPTLQDVISSSLAEPLESVLNKLLSEEYQEEVIRNVLGGLVGDENIEKYACDIAKEIKCKKERYSVLNSSNIKDLKCIPYFINYIISAFKTEVNSKQRSSETQRHIENNHLTNKCKQLSEEIAAQVSAHFTILVEKCIIPYDLTKGIKIYKTKAEMLMNENEDDEYIMQYNTEELGNEINECLQKSSVQEMLFCLSDVAEISIILVDEKEKWLHTIGKDKMGNVIKLNSSEIKEPFNSNFLFSEAAKLSGMPENKLKCLVVKHMNVQNESKLKESVVLKLYQEELQRIPRIEETPSKLSYLCREQYNQIAYRAFADFSQTLCEGHLKKVTVPAKKFNWHPDLMSCFKHTSSGAKQITGASAHKVVLKNPIKCREKACVLNIYPCEGGKTNLGSF